MKKSLLVLSAAAIAASGSLSARELLCEQCLPEPDCWEHLFVERCQWFVHGEFLYWGVAEGNLDYVRVEEVPTTLVGTKGKYKTADYEFRPGARVAASYYNCPKYWEVTAQYTWLKDRGTDSQTVASDGTSYLTPTQLIEILGPYERATSEIELGYQIGDVYAARVFDPNPHLRMRVYGGITIGWLKQEWDLSYTNLQDELETLEKDWRFFGGGIRMGLTADWFWGCQFYLTGRVSFATLYGSYKNLSLLISNDELIFCNLYDDPRFSYNVQFQLGPSWQIPCDCWSFELFAGYETNLWFNVQEQIVSENVPPDFASPTTYAQSVLGLHGLTLRLTLGF